METTKEFNEAVEKIVSIIKQKRNLCLCDIHDVVSDTLDALGIEIASNENCVKFSKHLALNHFGQDIILIRDDKYCDVVAQVNPDYLDVVFDKLHNNKPAVYLENIKGAE